MASKKDKAIGIAWKQAGKTEIRFTEGIFDEGNPAFAEMLRSVSGGERPRIALVADGNFVYHNQGVGSAIGKYLQIHGITLAGKPIMIGGGEKLKSDSLQTFLSVEGAVLDARLAANDVVVALGGGTIFDLAGMAAATARGGARLVRIPTTPSAIVDGVFAEYGALDSLHVKDAIRVPVRADGALIDLALAKSVLDGVWRGGIAELVRFAVASDAKLFAKIEETAAELAARNPETAEAVFSAAVERRAKLGDCGFALWIAHTLEPMSSYKLPHGYAVAIGVALETAYAAAKGYIGAEDAARVTAVLESTGALDGLVHSRHLVVNFEALKRGEREWRHAAGGGGRPVLKGLGEVAAEPEIDFGTLDRVAKELVAAQCGSRA